MASAEVGTAHVTIYPKTEKGFSNQVGQSIGDDIGKGLSAKTVAIGNVLGNMLTRAADAAMNAVGEVIGGAFDNFAQYEQLVGGVETLFKDSADIVEGYAQNAYKTAGLSANAYMETVTGFSASLLQSLGGDTEKAAKYADMAVTDMSDNANKMGSDMQSIQNAYQGFAKQNYTMLDNLKLGYGGTKAEMERLLADASELAGIEFSIDSYSDVIEAIHVIQEEMGIAGTTSEEAATTIEGSANAMKAAWDNWLTSLGTADMDVRETTAQLIESVKTYLENAIPVIGEIFLSIGEVVKEGLAQIIGKDNAEALFQGVADAASFLADAFQPVIDAISHIAEGVGPRLQGFFTAMQPVLSGIGEVVGTVLAGAFEVLGAAITIVADAVSWLWDNVLAPFGEWLQATFGPIIEGIGQVLGGIGEAVGGAMEAASGAVTQYGDTMVQTMGGDWQAAAIQAEQSFAGVESSANTAMAGVESAVNKASTQISKDMDFANTASKAESDIEEASSGMAESVESASSVIEAAPAAMVSAFNGVGAQLTSAFGTVHFPQPHISYQNVEAGDKTVRIPSIEWYATGAFFDGAQLIGAGESGAEMLLPQRGRMMDLFADALTERLSGGVPINITVNARTDADPNEIASITARKLRQVMIAQGR